MLKVYLLLTFCFMFLSCSDFPSRFDRLDGNKIRPLTIICEPPEVSPGDTVKVKLVGEFPFGIPDIKWTVAFDFKEDQSANDAYERNVVPVESLLYMPENVDKEISFSFVIPDTALLLASSFKTNPAIAALGITPDSLNTLLSTIPAIQFLPLAIAENLSLIGARIKLRAHMVQGITLDITKPLTVRFLRKFNLPNSNRNPATPLSMHLIRVKSTKMVNTDSLSNYEYDSLMLQSTGMGEFPQIREFVGVPDTIKIDKKYQYFIRVDTAAITAQRYPYFSIITNKWEEGEEEVVDCSWFSQNMDEEPGMVRDSLVLMAGMRGFGGFTQQFLPSVDKSLNKVRFHVVIRDRRDVDPFKSTGTTYMWAEMYFKY